MQRYTRAIGMDIALNATGVCWLQKAPGGNLVGGTKCITFSGIKGDARMFSLVTQLLQYIDEHPPDVVVCEDIIIGRGKRTAAEMARIHGAIQYHIYTTHPDIDVVKVHPSQLASFQRDSYYQDILLRLHRNKEATEHEDDAIGLALLAIADPTMLSDRATALRGRLNAEKPRG